MKRKPQLRNSEVECHLIFGALGQDGSYLAQQLSQDGKKVIGIIRNSSIIPPNYLKEKITYIRGDILDSEFILAILKTYKPTHIYNMASASSVSESHVNSELSLKINYEFVRLLIDCIDKCIPAFGREVFMLQASSSEMFGPNHQSAINEGSLHNPLSPYAEHKSMAHNLCTQARGIPEMKIGIAILFNHESPRRPVKFVSRKITRGAFLISRGYQEKLILGNLEISRDWGYAPDFVNAMKLIAYKALDDDFVIATGKLHTINEMCSIAFEAAGIMNFNDYINSDSSLFRANENTGLFGDSTKLRQFTSWNPDTTFEQMIKKMVLAEFINPIKP